MKKNYFNLFILFLIFNTSYSFSQNNPWKQTPQGINYQVFEDGTSEKNIQIGDYITFEVMVKNHQDSIIVNSYTKESVVDIEVKLPMHPADIAQIFPYLSKGDSVICRLSTDSLKKYGQTDLPSFTPHGTFVQYFFKILAVKSIKETEQKDTEAYQKRKVQQTQQIKAFAKEHQIELKSHPSGLFYHIQKLGEGAYPKEGDAVKVRYVGKRLKDNKIFDTNILEVAKAEKMLNEEESYEPFEFILGQEQVIEGWEEGMKLLNAGSKALFFIPSDLAYGAYQIKDVLPAHALLLFEVELIEIDFKKK
jgi:FKBP-type peptidyl-prolyl cis-trans isomerase